MQVQAQALPETFIVVIGQVEGFEDGEIFGIMESNGENGSMFFHKSIPDDNGTIKDGVFTAIYPYQRKVTGRFELILPGLTLSNNLPLIFYANPGDTIHVEGKGEYPCLWSVRSKASEQKDWQMIQQATSAEELAYQKAKKDHYDYRTYRRETKMDEAEWERTSKLLQQKATQVDSLRHVLYIAQLEAMKTLPASDVWMQTLTIMTSNFTPQKVKEKGGYYLPTFYNGLRQIFPCDERYSTL